MKRAVFVFLIILVFFGIIAYKINSNPNMIISHYFSLKSNDTGVLVYKVNAFNLITVGEAEFWDAKIEDYNGKEVYRLRASARTGKFVSNFFKASAELDSYVDIKSLRPVLFKEKVNIQGKAEKNKEISYDQEKGVMALNGVERTILSNTQDPLSIIYNIREMDLEKIKEFEFSINTNQKNYIFKARVTPQNINLNNRRLKIFVIDAEIMRRDNNPYHKTMMHMVFLKDKKNIPVYVRVFASGGLIGLKLVDVK